MEKYNISKPEKYTDKQGVEKTFWVNVGTMTKFFKQDGSINTVIEIPAIGLKANVFKIEPKVAQEASQETPKREPVIDPITGIDCNAEDIPF